MTPSQESIYYLFSVICLVINPVIHRVIHTVIHLIILCSSSQSETLVLFSYSKAVFSVNLFELLYRDLKLDLKFSFL